MENDNSGKGANPTIAMFPLLPSNSKGWFAFLERQFRLAQITDDETKFVTLVKCLEGRYVQHGEDILDTPPAAGSYEKLKCALILALTDTDNTQVKKHVESEEMGDRKPSEFYQHLRKLASPSTPDDFVLSLWRTRLPDNIRRILVAVDDSDSERLLHQADLIAAEFQQDHQRIYRIAAVIPSDAETNEPWVAAFNTLSEQMTQMRVQVQALSVSNNRRPRSRPRQRTRYRRRSRSRDPPRKDGLCYYHATFGDRARACRSPCTWNSGNATSRP